VAEDLLQKPRITIGVIRGESNRKYVNLDELIIWLYQNGGDRFAESLLRVFRA
jgi:hypothetical protein